MALGSTQPLTEISTRKFPGGKCGRCVGLTTLPPLCAVVMKSGNLNFLEPSGPLQACNGTDLPYTKRQRREVLSLSRQTECTRSGSWRRSALDAGEWSTSAFGHITTAREPRCLWNRRLGEPLNILWTILDTNKCISPAGIRYPNNLARSSSLHRPLNVKTCAIYIYMLRSKIENAH